MNFDFSGITPTYPTILTSITLFLASNEISIESP